MWPQIRPLPCHPWLPVKPEVAAKLPPGLLHPPLPSVFGSPWTLASVFGGELFKGEGEEEGFMEKKKTNKKTKQQKKERRRRRRKLLQSHWELKLHPGSQAAPLVARSPAHKVLLFHF